MYVVKCMDNNMFYKEGSVKESVLFTPNIKEAARFGFYGADHLASEFNNELDGNYQVLKIVTSKGEAWGDYYVYSGVSSLDADEFKMADIEQAFYDGFDDKDIGDSPYKEYWEAGKSYRQYYRG